MVKVEIEESELEDLKKKVGEIENYKSAVQEERSKRKGLEKDVTDLKIQLDDAVAAKATLEEKDGKDKGKYEKQIQEKDAQIAELTTKVTAAESKAAKYDEGLTANLNEKLSKIPAEKKEFVEKILKDKSYEEQLELLDPLIADYTDPNFKVKPTGDGGVEVTESDEYKKAKEAGDVAGMLKHAPKKEGQADPTAEATV